MSTATMPTSAARRAWPSVPGRLRWAWAVTVVFHGGLLLFGSFRGTYDAYVHIFLGDHYARDWFSTWDTRWYTGFSTVSYPPGTHQAIAFVSRAVGLEMAFVIVQLGALLLLVTGMYRFGRCWVDERAAATGALLLALSSTVAQTVHLFGQLPTTFAAAFLLHAIPFIRRWVVGGRFVDLACGVVALGACTAGHHVTTLFGSVFFLGPVVVHALLERSRVPRDDELITGDIAITRATFGALVARRFRRMSPALLRAGVLAPCIVLALVAVVAPYWISTATDPINQVSIPHGSRANFLGDLNLGLMFFVIPWGLALLVLPYAVVRAVLDKKWPIAASIVLLFVLGTGGTTPIPKLLLGGAFDILTLDRFTTWGAIQVMPLAGLFVTSLEDGSLAAWLRGTGGRLLLRVVQAVLAVAYLGFSLFSATLGQHRAFQPATIDIDPVVSFLEKDDHDRWRYLTLGFGDQMAWLSANTLASQVDGNYHSARRLPELTSTSVERLEGAKYRSVGGLGSLQQFLEVPEKYHLKYVFSNDRFYDPLLHVAGWQSLGPLENGIDVWERADVEPLPSEVPVREVAPWQRAAWGVIPPVTIVAALVMLLWAWMGRPGVRSDEHVDWRRQEVRLVRGPLMSLDLLLWRSDVVLARHGTLAPPKRSISAAALERLRTFASRPVGRRRRVGRIVVLIAVAATLPVLLIGAERAAPGPDDVVEAWFDDLDFRRFDAAWEQLDPDTRPDFELWRLQRSVVGGLVASYAKLDSIETEVIDLRDEADGRRAVVRADLRYLTSLDWHPQVDVVDLVERDGHWYVVPEDPGLVIPPEQLTRTATVDYDQAGRTRVLEANPDRTDIQDRPDVHIASARLVAREGRPVVVGEVVNVDVDPADLTIFAILRDADGEQLVRYNATDLVIHAIRPRESTPFLIEFEEVAAGVDLVEFDPLDFHPIELDDRIASVEIYARAVVTEGGLYRGLQLNQVELVGGDHGDGGETAGNGPWRVVGELRNGGTSEATVPALLFSFLDAEGRVAWVEGMYVDESIRPQRHGAFEFELPDLSDLAIVSLPLQTYSQANPDLLSEALIAPRPGVIELPPETGFSQLRIDVTTFVASNAS